LVTRLSNELAAVSGSDDAGRTTAEPSADGVLARWEDLLAFIVDPESPLVRGRDHTAALLTHLLGRAGLDETAFWKLERARRGQLFLSAFAAQSHAVPELELTAFDVDKLLKERFRREPLTVGSAWHHGYWRSYFSHAAITHPANDGLREEFSTAWHIVRKRPAVVTRDAAGRRLEELRALRLDMPLIIGPVPLGPGPEIELAYLGAIAEADPAHDVRTRSLVIVEADKAAAHAAELLPHAADLVVRVAPRHADALAGGALAQLLRAARLVELDPWDGASAGGDGSPTAAVDALARAVAAVAPHLIFSVFVRCDGPAFWPRLEAAARHDHVALVHYHAGALKSYRLTPRVDAFLKERLLRARVQLLCAGGDGDTMASAAGVYEAVLLGANGGAMTHAAAIALIPEVVDVLAGGDSSLVSRAVAEAATPQLREMAVCTLTCWQHSILEFLSCMGIDDVQKTSGNTMAITMTEDWVREVDALASEEFGRRNAAQNEARIAAEPVPDEVRRHYRVSRLLRERLPDLPLVNAARVLAQCDANYHLENSNRSLNADFLEAIYRMAAGEMPALDDFFLAGDQGPYSLDRVRLKLSRASVAWSLARLREDPALLDYIQLAVPRGFTRPGAVPPGASVSVHAGVDSPPLVRVKADARGGFEATLEAGHPLDTALRPGGAADDSGGGDTGGLRLRVTAADGSVSDVDLSAVGHGAHGSGVLRASADGAVTLKRDPRGGLVLSGFAVREPIWHAPVSHASMSLGAASEDFLRARIEGNAGIAMTSSGEGGPIRLSSTEDMRWESLQAASGHFGLSGADLRRVRDVEIKINQGAKPGKGGRLSGAKVTPTVSKARNIPVGTDALSPDPKHDIYSIEDMPAEVWLWLLYHTHCGIKITGSSYTRFVAAGMWSNFVVDYLLVDAGMGGSGNYHADSSHVGWPDMFRTMLHTHHALMEEQVEAGDTGELRPIRDANGGPYGASGGTRLFASGGLRGELDMVKVLIAGADGVLESSIGKAVAFGCTQCGNCYLDCPRGGITTKPELMVQNDRRLMAKRFRNWAVLNLVKLAVLIDALNHESGALAEDGTVTRPDDLLDDIRKLRGRTDLIEVPAWERSSSEIAVERSLEAAATARASEPPQAEHDSCRVGSLAVNVPVSVDAVWESARISYNGGNNRGGGIDFAGFAPAAVRARTCLVFNTIGPDRRQTMREIFEHLGGCRFFALDGAEVPATVVRDGLDDFRLPVREKYSGEDGWRFADLREDPGDYTMLFVELEPAVLARYGRRLLAGGRWLQRRTKYGHLSEAQLAAALDAVEDGEAPSATAAPTAASPAATPPAEAADLAAFVDDVREEYFTVLAHVIDSRYYRTHAESGAPAGKFSAKRRGYVVSMGQDLAAVKISGWTHTIPEYFDFGRLWAGYPGFAGDDPALKAHVWGMHHRYPTNSPAIDAEGRGNPAGAHPFKAFNVLLMHNGEQVGVDSTAPFLAEYGYVHTDDSMGEGHVAYEGDSVYDRKALTDTEYAAYLVDFTRRVLGLDTEEASQVISPITGLDLEAMDSGRRRLLELLSLNYIQLTPTGPYKFTIVESRPAVGGAETGVAGAAVRRVGFRENMDIKFLRPHELVASVDTSPGGVHVLANGSEAKIADSMLRVLHDQGVLKDAGHDLRFSMRPGGNPGRGEFGGVVEAFLTPGDDGIDLRNRFGEPVEVPRAGTKTGAGASSAAVEIDAAWRDDVDAMMAAMTAELTAAGVAGRRFLGPGDPLPPAGVRLVETTLERLADITGDDYRALVEEALPAFARQGDMARSVALRVLTELRKRVLFADLGGKALSSIAYLTDGGRGSDGSPEGGIYRVLDAVPPLATVLAEQAEADHAAAGGPRYARLTLATRDDLLHPTDAGADVLVIDFAGFASESFGLDCASRILAEAVRLGWRNLIGYDCVGGPRYLGCNLSDADGASARGVVLELYGREVGDFLGALLEGADVHLYGQGQCHLGMKAESGSIFVLQDALNTCCYAAHGGSFSVWDSGSRFAVAGQNKVLLDDGETPAQGFRSIHFGMPNEYAFEYLMSGGDNSLHVVLGLAKPDARGELALRAKPYFGKFFMSGAAAGRVFVFDPEDRLEPAQYHGNVLEEITEHEWRDELAPYLAAEAARRGVPLRVEGDDLVIRLAGEWRRWRYDQCFIQLVPQKVARRLARRGVTPPQLTQLVEE